MGTAQFSEKRSHYKEKLRLLFVDSEKVWRGGQEQVCSLIKGMLEQGHSVYLAAPKNSPLAHQALSLGAIVLPLQQRFELSLLTMWRLFRLMKKQLFDIVHFNTQRPIIAGTLAAKISQKSPLLICSRRVNYPLPTRLSQLKLNLLMDQIITVSESVRKTLTRSGVSQLLLQVIYEGRDIESIDLLPFPSLHIKKNHLVIGIVAHLSQEKGHSTLIRAIAILLKSCPNVTLLIVGEGELRNNLQQLSKKLGVEKNISFLGFRSDADSIMKCFDVFCLPSLSEGLGSVILAAMANHLPVVATTVGGIPELVIDQITGLLVPPRDPKRLSQALQKLINSPDLRKRMGGLGRKRIEKHFTLEQNIKRTERLYWELLGTPPIK